MYKYGTVNHPDLGPRLTIKRIIGIVNMTGKSRRRSGTATALAWKQSQMYVD